MGCIKSRQGLNRCDIEFLMAHTCYDEKTIKQWYKNFKKDCPDGQLTKVKFLQMYKVFFPSGNAEHFCEHIFRTFDTNQNGYIDFKEFLLALDVTSAGTAKQKLEWAFRMYDVDNNGVIDQAEMKKIVQSIYDIIGTGATRPRDTAEERAMKIFSRMDENSDGLLTEDEFTRGCLQDEEISKMIACR